MSTTVAAVINTYNEEENIEACIRSLGPVGEYVDEIVVCDNFSQDRTAEIAEENGARILLHERESFVTLSRRYAYSQIKADWVFVIDADERPTLELLRQIRVSIEAEDVDVYRFAKLQYILGGFVRHGGWFDEIFPQLFRRQYFLNNYRADKEGPHEDFASLSDALRAKIIHKETGAYLIHYAYDDLKEFAERAFGYYCPIEARHLQRRGSPWSVGRMISAPVRAFIKQYVLASGYRDGLRGLVLAILMAQYNALVELNKWFLYTQKQRHSEGDGL